MPWAAWLHSLRQPSSSPKKSAACTTTRVLHTAESCQLTAGCTGRSTLFWSMQRTECSVGRLHTNSRLSCVPIVRMRSLEAEQQTHSVTVWINVFVLLVSSCTTSYRHNSAWKYCIAFFDITVKVSCLCGKSSCYQVAGTISEMLSRAPTALLGPAMHYVRNRTEETTISTINKVLWRAYLKELHDLRRVDEERSIPHALVRAPQ